MAKHRDIISRTVLVLYFNIVGVIREHVRYLNNDTMDPYERFIWREARPGTWQRDIDEPEQFYAAIAKLYEGSGRMFFAITGHISLIIIYNRGLITS